MFIRLLYLVHDVALCRNTVRNVLLVSEWLATPGIDTASGFCFGLSSFGTSTFE